MHNIYMYVYACMYKFVKIFGFSVAPFFICNVLVNFYCCCCFFFLQVFLTNTQSHMQTAAAPAAAMEVANTKNNRQQ